MLPGGARPNGHAGGDGCGFLLMALFAALPVLIAVLWIASALGHPLAVP